MQTSCSLAHMQARSTVIRGVKSKGIHAVLTVLAAYVQTVGKQIFSVCTVLTSPGSAPRRPWRQARYSTLPNGSRGDPDLPVDYGHVAFFCT